MARVLWPLHRSRPMVRIFAPLPAGPLLPQVLLADTGAGTVLSGFELLLEESVCLLCGGPRSHPVVLGGAYSGAFPVYVVRVQIPEIGVDQHVRAAGIRGAPTGFDGIAAFRFLNSFTYGNFGDPTQFGLET